MATQPPPFKNASTCSGCRAGFTMVKRKHHCRACGATCCNGCSGRRVPLPRFGFREGVRVCDKCYAYETGSGGPRGGAAGGGAAGAGVAPADCKCGLPFCVCKPGDAAEAKRGAPPAAAAAAAPRAADNSRRPKPVAAPTTTTFLGFGGASSSSSSSSSASRWDLTRNLDEQCRDAIKAGDADGVGKLLGAGANAKYCDRTGNSLLHLAAMFNRADMVKLLLARGADAAVQNPGGETPLDLAPPALAHRMRNGTV